jgi:hypothetical protein
MGMVIPYEIHAEFRSEHQDYIIGFEKDKDQNKKG